MYCIRLTASVVKILCHIEKANLTFIDKENLIDNAINWIMRQRREDGSLKEADPRLSQESLQYKIMLAADVMISLLECNKDEEQEAAELIMGLVTFIENNIDNINNSLALAKAAYAMKLFEIDSESTAQIITKLKEFMKRDKLMSNSGNQLMNVDWYRSIGSQAFDVANSGPLVWMTHHVPALGTSVTVVIDVVKHLCDGHAAAFLCPELASKDWLGDSVV
uniref:Alpha-macroglobulin-like TED domain-containing protein n=1 Tax=Biomphalaria glabrata TaxID=6526 RepID=A0A2C9JBH7_BIOGL